MKENFTSIIAILDRSGSMASLTNDTIGGFNHFLNAQKAEPGEAILTLAIFDDRCDIVYNGVDLQSVPELTKEVYFARGSTALLDAIGTTITSHGAKLAAMNEEDRPSKVLVLIMTDGDENVSREFTRGQIMDMINHQKDKYSWSFSFIGANQDAIKGGASLGINASSSYNYTSSSHGTHQLYDSLSVGVASYRSCKTASTSFAMPDPNAGIKSTKSSRDLTAVQPNVPADSTVVSSVSIPIVLDLDSDFSSKV